MFVCQEGNLALNKGAGVPHKATDATSPRPANRAGAVLLLLGVSPG